MAAKTNITATMLHSHVNMIRSCFPAQTKRMKTSPVKMMKWKKACVKVVNNRIERHAFFIQYTYDGWYTRKHDRGDTNGETDHLICKGMIMALDFLL